MTSSRAPGYSAVGMRVAVCVKEVPDTAVPRRIDPGTMRLDRSGEGTLNPWDLSAIEEALRLVEAGGGEVVCVSMGPERAGASLRKALAMGADRSVLVADEAATGSDLVATSRVLALGGLVHVLVADPAPAVTGWRPSAHPRS